MSDVDAGGSSMDTDAGSAMDAGGEDETCDFGQAQSLATSDTLDLFGEIVFYNDGADLPEGRYRVTYIDGCMKYAGSQDWTINAYEDGSIAWFLGTESGDRFVMLPGTVGYAVSNGAYAEFEDCVDANLAVDPIEFDFDGGPLGVWLADSNYPDNVAGEDGRNPSWQLERLEGCE